MTEENTNTSEQENAPNQDAVVAVANKLLQNVNLSEALSLVSLSAVIQLVQNQVMTQANEAVSKMSDEEIEELLNPPAEDEGDEGDEGDEKSDEASTEEPAK
jgi:hypothetical protein